MLKRLTSAVTASLLAAAILAGCTQTPATTPTTSTQNASSSSASASQSQPASTITFTDSAGRNVDIPANIERIAPSGPTAQMVLYTLCPDKLSGLAAAFSTAQKTYVAEKYWDLPALGNLYDDTLNREALVAAAPQLIIDIGEPKNSVKEDMDGIQEQTGIPTVFIKMDLATMAEAYNILGSILGEDARATEIASYITSTLAEAAEKSATIPEENRLTVYYGQEASGLIANVAGTVHSDVIDIVGGINVAEVESNLRGGLNELSMEQLILWDPDVIIFPPEGAYEAVPSNPEWADISAVQNGRIYEIPINPYNWMGRPPSVNRILGIKWLGNLLYPTVFDYDMIQETKAFYGLFYHADITDDEAQTLMQHSTYK